MSFDKDRAIIAQNSSTGAATIIAALVNQRGDTSFNQDEFDQIRQFIFEGTLELAGAEAIVSRLESGTGQLPPQQVSGGGSAPNADFELKNGKHAGKTLAAIDQGGDRQYLEWAAENLNNDFAKKRISEYVRATAA